MPTLALAMKAKHLDEKLAKIKEEMAKLDAHEKLMLASPDAQVSLTDPDSRLQLTMASRAVLEDQHYQALKALRALLPREERLFAAGRA